MGETQQSENIDECEPDKTKTSTPPDADNDENVAKDDTSAAKKEAYQAETDSLLGNNSIDAAQKDNADDEDFQPGTPSSSDNDDNDDDDMESDENIPRGCKRKNQG